MLERSEKKWRISFDERGMMIVNQVCVFAISITSLIYGLLIYFNFLACNCINLNIFNLEQKIQQYGLTVVAEMFMDLLTLPLVLYNISRLYQNLTFNPFFELLFETFLFIRVISGSLMYYYNLQADELAYFSYTTFHNYCQSLFNITQDQCTVLEYINSYSNSNLTLVCLTTINLMFFILFYHINYKKDILQLDSPQIELQQDKAQLIQ